MKFEIIMQKLSDTTRSNERLQLMAQYEEIEDQACHLHFRTQFTKDEIKKCYGNRPAATLRRVINGKQIEIKARGKLVLVIDDTYNPATVETEVYDWEKHTGPDSPQDARAGKPKQRRTKSTGSTGREVARTARRSRDLGRRMNSTPLPRSSRNSNRQSSRTSSSTSSRRSSRQSGASVLSFGGKVLLPLELYDERDNAVGSDTESDDELNAV